jgi:hypothetical protein
MYVTIDTTVVRLAERCFARFGVFGGYTIQWQTARFNAL